MDKGKRFLTAAVIGMLFLSNAAVGSTAASFVDTETIENVFSASSLDIELNDAQTSTSTHIVALGNAGVLATNYTINALLQSSATSTEFCDDLNVTAERDGTSIYAGPLEDLSATSTALGAGDEHDLAFVFSVEDEDGVYSDDCEISFIYNANQDGFAFGEAFFDTETDTIILNGADFGDQPILPLMAPLMFAPMMIQQFSMIDEPDDIDEAPTSTEDGAPLGGLPKISSTSTVITGGTAEGEPGEDEIVDDPEEKEGDGLEIEDEAPGLVEGASIVVEEELKVEESNAEEPKIEDGPKIDDIVEGEGGIEDEMGDEGDVIDEEDEAEEGGTEEAGDGEDVADEEVEDEDTGENIQPEDETPEAPETPQGI